MSRDQRRAPRDPAPPRTNEYFVPRDGIDREVITADICRYLGNDALVRPGNYENPQTGQVQSGYFITAYRNLTTPMIADLKADSDRWENERRANSARGHASNVEYRTSTTHQSRQYYGPTDPAPSAPGPAYGSAAVAGGAQQEYAQNYASGYPQPSSSPYGQSAGYPPQDGNYAYVSGANLENEQASRAGRGAPLPPQGQIPRTGYPAQPPTSYADTRGNTAYYPSQAQPAQASSQQYGAQPADPYYGRAPPVAGYTDTQEGDYRNYPEASGYSQAPITSTTATAHPAPRREDRDRNRDSDRERRHRSHR